MNLKKSLQNTLNKQFKQDKQWINVEGAVGSNELQEGLPDFFVSSHWAIEWDYHHFSSDLISSACVDLYQVYMS